MQGGYPRRLLNLIPNNERNWSVKKKEDDHGEGDEKKLELRLGPPGVEEDWSAKNKPKPANTSQKRCAPAPVVGWPPIRSFRKNIASSSSKQSPPSDAQNGLVPNNVVKTQKMVESTQKGLFVKINMAGIPIGRKVDLSAYDSYQKLSVAVDQLFRGLLAAQNDTSGNEKAITGLLDGSGEYTLVYEDNEGDRMLVGDVPWHMFVSAVKRLRVIKSSEISTVCMGSKQEKVQRC